MYNSLQGGINCLTKTVIKREGGGKYEGMHGKVDEVSIAGYFDRVLLVIRFMFPV